MILKVIKYLKVILNSLKIQLKIIFIYLISSKKDQCVRIAYRNLELNKWVIKGQIA